MEIALVSDTNLKRVLSGTVMKYLRGGKQHVAFSKSAQTCIKGARSDLLGITAARIRQSVVSKKANKHSIHNQMVTIASTIYQAHLQKATRSPVRQCISMRVGGKSYKTFEKVVMICRTNHWLIGEYIAAQFCMMRVFRNPLVCHLASAGAEKRYLRFLKLLKNQPGRLSVAQTEQQAIERATFATCNNLINLLLARNRAVIIDDDFSYCDRYTLTYFHREGILPVSQMHPDVAEEIDRNNLEPARYALLQQACKVALQQNIEKIRKAPGHINGSLFREQALAVVSKLYKA